MTDATDLILKTKELIERDGWAQCAFRDCDGRRCLIGALTAASSELDARPACCYVARMRIAEFTTGNGLIAWNDKPGRTKAEVLDLLAEAAKGHFPMRCVSRRA